MKDLLKAIERFPTTFRQVPQTRRESCQNTWYRSIAIRDCPKTFEKGRLCSIGDADHPMQTTHGAGASTGLEEAAVLVVSFDRGVKKEEEGGAVEAVSGVEVTSVGSFSKTLPMSTTRL